MNSRKAAGIPYYPVPRPGECGDLREVPEFGRTAAKRPLCRSVCDVPLLQHGSGDRSGIEFYRKLTREDFGSDHKTNLEITLSACFSVFELGLGSC